MITKKGCEDVKSIPLLFADTLLDIGNELVKAMDALGNGNEVTAYSLIDAVRAECVVQAHNLMDPSAEPRPDAMRGGI